MLLAEKRSSAHSSAAGPPAPAWPQQQQLWAPGNIPGWWRLEGFTPRKTRAIQRQKPLLSLSLLKGKARTCAVIRLLPPAGSTEREGYNSRLYSRPIYFFHSMVKSDAVRCVPQVETLLIDEMGWGFVSKILLQGMLCISVDAVKRKDFHLNHL